MNIGDKVILIEDFEAFNAFPLKYQDSKMVVFNSGTQGVIEEVYPNGGGIVNLNNGKRVLIWDLKSRLKKEGVTA